MSAGPAPAAPRLIADAMLVRLARWLRALGVDTELAGATESDAALVARARADRRVVLTRDRRLADECGDVACVLLRADTPLGQLGEVMARFAIRPRAALFTRCLLCNVALEPLDPASAPEWEAALPPSVRAGRGGPTAVRRCPRCGRLYWEGSHTRRMRTALARELGPALGWEGTDDSSTSPTPP